MQNEIEIKKRKEKVKLVRLIAKKNTTKSKSAARPAT